MSENEIVVKVPQCCIKWIKSTRRFGGKKKNILAKIILYNTA